MIPFLDSVARAYLSEDAPISNLEDVLFVFPNKRSGSFFLKYLKKNLNSPAILPECITISELVERMSLRTVDSRLDMIFLLFECYKEIVGEGLCMQVDKGKSLSFDNFRLWGETALNDFVEVDRQLVNPQKIFKNVKDFREISSNFITLQQRKIMEEYFGYRGESQEDGLWRSFGEVDDDGVPLNDSKGIKSKFLYLWQVLFPLYTRFNEKLDAMGLTTPGGVYRLALKNLKERGVDLLSPFEHVAFVGFNALSNAEREIFSTLRNLKSPDSEYEDVAFADFFWDADGPIFDGEDNPAARYVRMNGKWLPSPRWALRWLSLAVPTSLPDIKIVASPSNVAQIKIVGDSLEKLVSRPDVDNSKMLNNARVAVVLPDEKLLQPLLYSLPETVGSPNLTMGYPMRQTAVASFVSLLRRLLLRQRLSSSGRYGFFFDDLKLFLAHPFCQSIFGSRRISNFLNSIARNHRFVVYSEHLSNLDARAAEMLRPLPPNSSELEVADYVDGILQSVTDALSQKGSAVFRSSLESQHIVQYRDCIAQLKMALQKYQTRMKPATMLSMLDRLISAESVPFKGEPLRGLQVMGMLETRCLDFDYIFVPSLNERIMPRRARLRTFIPNNIRKGFGMPPANYQEDIFAYYFFRLLSRCSRATLLYDSRVGENSGDISRYLLQIIHMLPEEKVRLCEGGFTLTAKTPEYFPVEKRGSVAERLKDFFRPGSGLNLSASALQNYLNCPLKFFYENVLKISTDRTPSEAIDPTTAGTIIHGVMQNLYLNGRKEGVLLDKPVRISADYIRSLLNDEERLIHELRAQINKCHFNLPENEWDAPLSGSSAIVAPGYLQMIRNILEYDLGNAPCLIYGCEVKATLQLPMSDGNLVNCRFAIDRIDRPGLDDEAPLRIVDYKTGVVHLEASNLGVVFSGDYNSSNVTQLLLYAALLQQFIYEKHPDRASLLNKGLRVSIYDVPKMLIKGEALPVIGGVELQNAQDIEDEFSKKLDNTLLEIFDESLPFSPKPEGSACTFCPLTGLCRR